MIVEPLGLGVLRLQPRVFADARGRFVESWHAERYGMLPGNQFVQDNVSVSRRNVLRGLHYQYPHAQGKLVTVLHGRVWDVAVDIRRGSPTFGQWLAATLDGSDLSQLYIPPGIAHGFVVLSDEAVFQYKCTDYYDAACDGSIAWNDPDIGIDWPIAEPILSAKDASAPMLKQVAADRLPHWVTVETRVAV